MEKKIHIQYFASLREQRGCAEETLTTAASDAKELYQELYHKHQFSLPQQELRVAINDSFQEWDVTIKNGDHVVFIPPVAGG